MTDPSDEPDATLRSWSAYIAAIARDRVSLGRTRGTSLSAADLLQVALIGIWKESPRLAAAGWPRAFVARVSHCAMAAAEAKDRRKWGRVGVEDPEVMAVVSVEPETADGFGDLLAHVRPDRRDLVAAKFSDGLSHADLAAIRGVSESRIGQLVADELAHLRGVLKAENRPG